MDAGKYYALLRFEEAAQALRVALKLGIVEKVGDQQLTRVQFAELFDFTPQGARTYIALLEVLEILEGSRGIYSIAPRAKEVLADDLPSSRKPYLLMGSGPEVDALIDMLRGDFDNQPLPLYGDSDTPKTLMDVPIVARDVAVGLSSRSRNFAQPLADAIAPYATKMRILADLGAGSPYVGLACLQAMPHLSKVKLVDRPNGMKFVRELAAQIESLGADTSKLEYCEEDFFRSVPGADIYCVSNTAHDWLPEEYEQVITNLRDSIAPGGVVCIHEPLLPTMWNNSEQWIQALWMTCYALSLYKLTAGKGSCYTHDEHRGVMEGCGFGQVGEPVETQDGCTAIFFQLVGDIAIPTPASAQVERQKLQSAPKPQTL